MTRRRAPAGWWWREPLAVLVSVLVLGIALAAAVDLLQRLGALLVEVFR